MIEPDDLTLGEQLVCFLIVFFTLVGFITCIYSIWNILTKLPQ